TYNGVKVQTGHTVSTILAQAIPGNSTTSTKPWATATATIQAVQDPLAGLSPFAVCANAYTGNGNKETVDPNMKPLLVSNPDVPGTLMLNYPAAENMLYSVWSNGGGSSNVSDCGFNSQNFNGLICGVYKPTSDPTNTCAQQIDLPTGIVPVPADGENLSITNGAV